ncbi:FtsW/RodA/SpoVE family cell cycle protein [Candidatus Nanosyncoccus alces]|uniref:Probable peptidoglycan glycosyltransferase FtsW n=1 Tax=Candidatus Nanosyncoccus alces TaxID=2171997 RepID=A0ABY0FNQ8_9BACT|nr:putative peptidoglycan glycosyltransferase FtsW [Candidatus Nanosyncoccus alces]RYC74569.1 putative peptidoglycan glycosyltransferase FtsW [Candidatus Nanosyncoccus alces]
MAIIRKHKSDLVILFTTLGLMALGLIVIYAIGPMRANVLNSTYGSNYDSNFFFVGQLRSVGLSLLAFFAAFKWVPYKYIKKTAKPIMIIALALSGLLWILSMIGSSLVKCELGECRWFNFGGLSFQPAELLKLAMVIYLADFLARKREEGVIGKWQEFWVPLIIICGISLFLVVIAQGDLGTGVALIAIIFGMLLISGVPAKQYLIMLAVVLAVAVGSVVTSSHRMERVDAWLTTLTGGESTDSTYHVENAMLAIGTGGMFGVGVGNSVQATGYLPESINDSVFAIMGETFGFIGLFLIIAVFGIMLLHMLKVADNTPAISDRLLITGVFSWTLAQVVVNIMAMTSLVPVTGITLPLLSYGGTSMIFIAFAIGLVLQLSCYTSREVSKNEDISSRRGVRGAHHSGSRRSS